MELHKLDGIVDRKNTNSIKWEFIEFMYPEVKHEVLPLWVADMDFPCAEEIIKALHERVDKQIFGYSSFDESYYDSVKNWFSKNYLWEIAKEDIFFSPGIVPALGLLINALTEENDGVIIQQPVYYPFMNMIKNNGRKIVNNPLINNEGYYTMDYEHLEKVAADPKNTMMILCSPHNPVGRVWTREELEKVHEICTRHGVIIISDEIHCDLVRKDVKHISFHTLGEAAKENVIICTSPSKTFNLAGLQLSNVIISNPEYKEKWLREIKDKLSLSIPSPFAITATKAAYDSGEKWLENVKDYIDSNLEFMKEYIKHNLPKAEYRIPEGTYLAWVDFKNYGLEIEELKNLLLNKAKVALDDGVFFGDSGAQYQRFNVACPRSILKEALDRIKYALED